jgi:hypothetical protein
LTAGLREGYQTTELITPKNLIHYGPDKVDILVTNLHENAAGFREQFTGGDESVSQSR